jgi:tRNA (guanine-N7-)-methyltransferase
MDGGVPSASPKPVWRNFYGRRHGKKLKPNQQRWLEELLPRLRIPGVDPEENPGRAPLAPAALFDDGWPLWSEIGFGAGEHLAAQAAAHPGVGLIGCEPFVNGVAAALGKLAARDNVRIYPGDARDLIELLPDGALARVFLLYPDPWPKARHARRRFAGGENLAMLARVMAPGAELRIATDIAAYAAHAREAVATTAGLRLARDGAVPWEGWPGTRYERKALAAGRRPEYLTVLRG